MTDLLIATSNKHKAREIGQILAGLPFRIHSLAEFNDIPEIIEDGE
ncbi:non-canonical purine NTP pyrophosphatase, partial [Candidatus Margulisiibacteriota bacterium]